MSMVKHETVVLKEVQLHYAETTGAGPALILLHGITDSHVSYLPVMSELAAVWHVYALDMRGHGLSGHCPGAYRVLDYARDLQSFLHVVVRERAVLAGHSLGALVATCAAGDLGEGVRGVFLEDPPMYTASMPAIKDTATYSLFVSWREILIKHAATGGSADDLLEPIVDTVSPARLHTRAEQLHQLDPQVLDAVIEGTLCAGFNPDEVLARVVCPTHMLAADHDLGGALHEADVQRLVSKMPHCSYAVLEKVGHDIHHEWPGAYMRQLHGFLNILEKN